MTTTPDQNAAPSARAFAYPGFRLFYVGSVAGTNAGWILRILLSWLAWDLTRSPSFVGLVASASLLPVAFLGPIFGAVTDRMSIKTAFMRVTAALLVVPVAMLVLLVTGAMTPTALLILATVFGCGMAAYHPARQSIGPRLVDAPAIGAVVALSAVNFNLGRLLAPAIGGILIAEVGTVPVAVIAVAMLVPNAVIAPFLHPRSGSARREDSSLRADLVEGFTVVWQRWPIRRSLMIAVASLGLIRGVSEILPLVADGLFERGAQGLGLLTSTVGGGALVASLFQVAAGAALVRQRSLRFVIILIGFAGTLGLVYLPTFEMAMAAAALIGFSSTYVGVSLQIGLQARLEDDLRGRVMSIWMLSNTASTAALAFVISWLTEVIGMQVAVLLFVLICTAAVTAIFLTRTE